MDKFTRRVKRYIGVRLSQLKFLQDETSLRLLFWAATGEKLNLESPKTFNEKLQWLKLHDRNPDYQTMVDKIAAKHWAARLIGEQHIIPTIRVWDRAEDIKLDELPDQFVLKTNHDSGTVFVCKDKDCFDIEGARRCLDRSLKRNFYYQSREWPYKNIQPRVFAESYIPGFDYSEICEEDFQSDGIIDYKFLCYSGICRFLFTCTGREQGDLRVDFFDPEWNHLPFKRHYPNADVEIPKPKLLQKMIEIAETLSSDIPFVRVDLYQRGNHIYFGEMTFYPGAGLEEFTPSEWDLILGEPIAISPNSLKKGRNK